MSPDSFGCHGLGKQHFHSDFGGRLLGTFFAGAVTAAHLFSVEQNPDRKLLVMVRTGLREELIAERLSSSLRPFLEHGF